MLLSRVVIAVLAGIWAMAAMAAPLPKGFVPSDANGSHGPVVEAGDVTFLILPKDCSNRVYNNGSGETDCRNGNVKNLMRYTSQAKLGQSIEYKFDIWVDPAFSYAGYRQSEVYPFGGDGYDSRLRLAYWQGPLRKNFISDLKLDTRHGIAFLFKQCQAPEDFGKWVTFSMKIRWAGDDSGWIRVTCDDRLVYEAEGVVTNESVTCYLSNECDPQKPKKYARQIELHLGLSMNGWGPGWKDLIGPTIGPFTDFAAAGIAVKMRNVSITEGAELYTEADRELVRQLQERLNALGCAVGTPDGVPGKKTRAAAIACRQLPGLPPALTVGTLKTFLDLYGAADVT